MQPFWTPEYDFYIMIDSGAESSSRSGGKVGGGVAGALLFVGAAMIVFYFVSEVKD